MLEPTQTRISAEDVFSGIFPTTVVDKICEHLTGIYVREHQERVRGMKRDIKNGARYAILPGWNEMPAYIKKWIPVFCGRCEESRWGCPRCKHYNCFHGATNLREFVYLFVKQLFSRSDISVLLEDPKLPEYLEDPDFCEYFAEYSVDDGSFIMNIDHLSGSDREAVCMLFDSPGFEMLRNVGVYYGEVSCSKCDPNKGYYVDGKIHNVETQKQIMEVLLDWVEWSYYFDDDECSIDPSRIPGFADCQRNLKV